MCFHSVIKTGVFYSIFGNGWRKDGEKMEVTGKTCKNKAHALK